MGYQEELKKLQKIITSDDSTEKQRETARGAKKTLIDNSIDDAFKSFEDRSNAYTNLIGRLREVVDRIRKNQLTTAMEDLDTLVKDIKKAADGDD